MLSTQPCVLATWFGFAMPEAAEDEGATARYLLDDLPPDVTEQDLSEYFGVLGVLEDVTLRTLEKTGQIVGSVKFESPTFELRNLMLKEEHAIKGQRVTVQTHKMRKMMKPGYAESQAYQHSLKYREAKGKGKGVNQIPLGSRDTFGKAGDKGFIPAGGQISPTSAGGKFGPGAACGKIGAMPGKGAGKGGCCGGKADAWGGKGDAWGADWGFGAWGAGPMAAWGKGKGWNDPYGWDAYGCGGYGAWGGPWMPPSSAGPYGCAKGCIPLSKGKDSFVPLAKGKDKGKGKGKGKSEEDKDITARFLMIDLDEQITDEMLRDYFSEYAELEDVSVKTLHDGRGLGSVKFATPTRELRNTMLRNDHFIDGIKLQVSTWKMQKASRPGKFIKDVKEDEIARQDGKEEETEEPDEFGEAMRALAEEAYGAEP